MTTEQWDGYVEDAVRRAVVALRYEQCADGFHDFQHFLYGVYRCTCCGKAQA